MISVSSLLFITISFLTWPLFSLWGGKGQLVMVHSVIMPFSSLHQSDVTYLVHLRISCRTKVFRGLFIIIIFVTEDNLWRSWVTFLCLVHSTFELLIKHTYSGLAAYAEWLKADKFSLKVTKSDFMMFSSKFIKGLTAMPHMQNIKFLLFL